jgi:hypothetical protein
MYYWLRVSCGIVVVPDDKTHGKKQRSRERACRRKISRRNIYFGNRQKPCEKRRLLSERIQSYRVRSATLKFVNHIGVREA